MFPVQGSFDANKNLINQFPGHHGMLEQVVHMYATGLLFIASIVAILILYKYFRGAKYTWYPIMAGIFSTGLIGLGENLEYYFGAFGHDFFAYLHRIGAPLALYFFYVGITEYVGTLSEEEKKPMSIYTIVGLIGIAIVISLALATQADTPWDVKIERPFIYITTIPIVIIVVMVLQKAIIAYKSEATLMLNISLISVAVTLLALDILIGRQADIWANGALYIVTHAVQDILHAFNAALLIGFSLMIPMVMK
ncbi:MAG: hypothetical protein ACE5J3_11380 [Methanosarcinales archaeon]